MGRGAAEIEVKRDYILIDECLSPTLVGEALDRGYWAEHVAHRGLAGSSDWNLVGYIQKHDFIFVTNDKDDFLTLFASLDIHNGLIIIVPKVEREAQVTLFGQALDVVETLDHTINRVIEVAEDGTVAVRDWPSPA